MRRYESPSQTWSRLHSLRSPFLRRCEEMAALTIPKLCLPDGTDVRALTEPQRALWRRASSWLTDASMYASVPPLTANGAPAARMEPAAIETLRDFGIIEEIPRSEVRGWTKMFFVPEWAKNRRRPIKHTFIVNEALGKETLMPCRFPTKADICNLVRRGTHFIAFDFAAYFDQFEYAPEVGKLGT